MVFDAPSRWIRVCAFQTLLLIAITAATTRTTTAHPAGAVGAQVRSTDPVIRALIDRSRQPVADVPAFDRNHRGDGRNCLCRVGRLRTWRPGVPDDDGDARGELSDPSHPDRHAPETARAHGVDRSRAAARDRGTGEPRAGGHRHRLPVLRTGEPARTANRSKPVPPSRPGSRCGMRSNRPSTGLAERCSRSGVRVTSSSRVSRATRTSARSADRRSPLDAPARPRRASQWPRR